MRRNTREMGRSVYVRSKLSRCYIYISTFLLVPLLPPPLLFRFPCLPRYHRCRFRCCCRRRRHCRCPCPCCCCRRSQRTRAPFLSSLTGPGAGSRRRRGGGDGMTTTLVVGPGCNPRRESRGGGVRQRRAVAVCGGGVWLFSATSGGTLRGKMKRYVKNMSGHKFAEPGGGRSANLCFYDRHTYSRVKNRVKKT